MTRDAIYFVTREAGLTPVLARFDLSSRRVESIRPLDGLLLDSGLSLSPDGRFVFFTRVDRQDSDILLLERP